MKKIFISFLFSLGALNFANAQTTVTFQPDGATGKDAYIQSHASFVNSNNATGTQSPVSAWTYGGDLIVTRSLIQFDLTSIPTNAVVSSAVLTLYAWDNPNTGLGQHDQTSGSNAATLFKVTSAWNESSVTWNNQPSFTTTNSVSLPASTSATQNYNIDLTTLVQDHVTSPSTNYGYLLKEVTEDYYRKLNFASSDVSTTSLRPKLVVTYTVPVTNTCITFQPDGATGKDAYIQSHASFVNSNNAAGTQSPVSAWTYGGDLILTRSLIQFDLSSIPTSAIVESADLTLYAWDNANTGLGQHDQTSGSNAAVLLKVTSAWDESTVTWNNQPTVTTVNSVSLPASTSATQNYTLDISKLVQEQVTSNSNYGYLLREVTEDYYRKLNFASSDYSNANLRPKLAVCYKVPTGIDDEILANNSVSVFPNPANETLTVKVNPANLGAEYIIVDQLGHIVLSGKLGIETSVLNISNLASGVYILKVTGGTTVKLVKK